MNDDEVRNKFVELRAKNWSDSHIANELKVSKQTLITWNKELSNVIANLRAIEMEELQVKCLRFEERG